MKLIRKRPKWSKARSPESSKAPRKLKTWTWYSERNLKEQSLRYPSLCWEKGLIPSKPLRTRSLYPLSLCPRYTTILLRLKQIGKTQPNSLWHHKRDGATVMTSSLKSSSGQFTLTSTIVTLKKISIILKMRSSKVRQSRTYSGELGRGSSLRK